MPKINYKIFNNINKIGKKDWNALFGDIPESYAFYKTLENSELVGFKFFYLVIYRDSRIVLIAPLFSADFNLDISLEGPVSKMIKLIRRIFPRFLILKIIFCGSPFAEHGVLGINKDDQNSFDLVSVLLEGLNALAVKTGSTLVIFKDFLKQDVPFLGALRRYGYSKVESFPTVSIELNFASFEKYLQSLGKSTRKNLNKKLKQAYSRANIEVKVVQDAAGQIDRIVELYENTYRASVFKFEHLSRKFFLQVSRDLYPHTRFFLYYVDGKLAAFNLCLIYPDLLIDKYIGFDYDISNYYNLYFVSWAYNIKWCIENRLHHYVPGPSNYSPKIRMGGKLITLYAYLKHKNVFFNFLLKLLIPFLKPDNFDEDAKR